MLTDTPDPYAYRNAMVKRNKDCFKVWDNDDAFTELDKANAGEDRRSEALRWLRANGFRA